MPIALATAPLTLESKTPMVPMMAAAAIITEKSPFIVRASFSLPQAFFPIADWAIQKGVKSVVTVISDYTPAHDVENLLHPAI